MKIESSKKLGDVLKEYKEKNTDNKYKPVAVGRYGIRKREDIYSKELAKDYSKNKLIYKDTLTVGMGSKQIDIGILTEDAIYAVSPAYHTFRINNIDANYLHYCLDARNADMSERFMIASARQGKSVDFKKMLEYEIPVYSESDTQTILFNLSKIEEVILNLDNQLEKMDLLVKSRFIEMFGTLEKPKENYPQDCLENLCRKITDGKHGGCTRVEGSGRWFVGAREIYDDAVHYETAPEIDVDEFAKDYRRCNIEKGDFLIVNTGATIGKSAIASDDRTECTLLQKSVALLKVKTDILDPVFLKYCYAVNERMYRIGDGSAQPNLLLSKINKTEIYVPPLVKQNEFGMFVKEIDKSKLAVQEMKNKMEILKASVMQEYFC